MLNAVGFGALGVRGGSLAAMATSAAMGGAGLAPVAAVVVPVVAVTAVAAAAAAVAAERADAQQNGLGEGHAPHDLRTAVPKKPWVLIWENWNLGVFYKSFATHEEALARSEHGRKLRRMVVELDANGYDIENEHGHRNPWTEHDFHGENVFVDNTLRRVLRHWLNENRPGCGGRGAAAVGVCTGSVH